MADCGFRQRDGEVTEHKLVNGDGEAERFYRALESPALVGIEACGNSQWFVEVLTAGQRDLLQLLIHRHKLVEIRIRVKNGLQHLAMNRGLQKQRKLWSAKGPADLENLSLQGWAGRVARRSVRAADPARRSYLTTTPFK